MGWMMYDYDIVGNLYWMTNLYAWRQSAFGDFQLQDYYDTTARYPAANGDGFLFYPGRDYGVYGPIGTIRLHSIRDGNEDYDLAYALESVYKKYGVSAESFDKLYSLMSDKLYSGTMVRIRDGLTDYFAESRDFLASLLELAHNTNTVIKSIEMKDGNTTVTVETDADVVIKNKGETLTGTASGDRVSYTIVVPMTETVNYLDMSATKNDKTYALKTNLGGKSVIVNASTLTAKAQILSGGAVSTVTLEDMSALKLSYNAGDRQIAQIDVSTLGVDEKVGNVTIYVYSYSENTVDLKILSKCEKSQSFIESGALGLKLGWNKITIPITAFNCANYGKLTTLRFNLSETAAAEIAIGNIEIGG
jgi:hypothetical protein